MTAAVNTSHRFEHSIHSIPAKQWNQLLPNDNPFLRYEWFAALEDSGCISSSANQVDFQRLGWQAYYLLIEENDELVAIAPVFKKLHSYGEYVFDWSWADAYHRNGLEYYPKLLWAIPFTPSTGPRLITNLDADNFDRYVRYCANVLSTHCQSEGYSGWHCLYPEHTLKEALKHQTLSRQSCQFHWYNQSLQGGIYQNFDEFLGDFTSRKRKNARKERAFFRTAEIDIKRLTGDEITAKAIDEFYRCYQMTYLKRGMQGYLNLNFFQQLRETMAEQMLLVQANLTPGSCANGTQQNIANALYFKDEKNLYGRYWGCLDEYDSLHFECCYYQGIEYCIENELEHFDPGTQGEHKISRGFRPILCHSQHWIAHPQFRDAIDRFLQEETLGIHEYQQQASEHLPFKNIDHD